MELNKYDEKSLRVTQKEPSILDQLLFHLIKGNLPQSGDEDHDNYDQDIRDMIEYHTFDGPPAHFDEPVTNPAPMKDFKGNIYKSLDEYIQRGSKQRR